MFTQTNQLSRFADQNWRIFINYNLSKYKITFVKINKKSAIILCKPSFKNNCQRTEIDVALDRITMYTVQCKVYIQRNICSSTFKTIACIYIKGMTFF